MIPTSPNTQDARMTRVELAVQRVEDQVAQLVNDIGEFKVRMETLIEDHQVALYGDKGQPGLVGQAGSLEELRVALKGYGREPGLIADIRNLLDQMSGYEDNRKWLTRLIIGAIISEILIHVFGTQP